MSYSSCEEPMSRNLYLINQELLQYKNELIRKETNSISIKNCHILLSYIKNGAFNRIIRRVKNTTERNREIRSDYSLKDYNEFPQVKVVVYTCIWGKYDTIVEPYYVNPNIDYYIITDQSIPQNSSWKKFDINHCIDTTNMTNIEVNRYCKMLPHRLFKDYDYSIYVDGNIRIVTDMMPIIADMGESVVGIHKYPCDCIYDMAHAIIAGKRASQEAVNSQITKYKKAGFPKHFGAFECNVLVRKHNDSDCTRIMNAWWNEFSITTSKRDQLSLPFVLWKNKYEAAFVKSLGDDVRKNPRFQIGIGHK